MKIYYEPFPGFSRNYDFLFEDYMVRRLSFLEPEEPKLLKEIGVGYIVDEIAKKEGYIFSFAELPLMEQLLPEQIARNLSLSVDSIMR
jgi:hypothetical protein